MSNDIFKAISKAAGTSRSRKSEGDKWNQAAFRNAILNLDSLRDGKRLVSAKKDQHRTLNASTTAKTVCVLLKRGVAVEVINEHSATGEFPVVSERYDYSAIFASAGGAQETLKALAEQEGVEIGPLSEVLGVKVTKVVKRDPKAKDNAKGATKAA